MRDQCLLFLLQTEVCRDKCLGLRLEHEHWLVLEIHEGTTDRKLHISTVVVLKERLIVRQLLHQTV